MNKEELVQELLELNMIDEAAAAILLDRIPVETIPDFEWPQKNNNALTQYIDNHIRLRNIKRERCGCTNCTCPLNQIEIIKK